MERGVIVVPSLDYRVLCHLQLHRDPFLRLAPHRVEELNMEPYILLLHRSTQDL